MTIPVAPYRRSSNVQAGGADNASSIAPPVTLNPGLPNEKAARGQELNRLREEIRRESDAYQHHMKFAGYEDTRQRPLSTSQKIKDLLVWVKMAGSGHQPGHVPNRALQQASRSKERLKRLTERYIPLAKAEALAEMGDQLMAAEDKLKHLSGDKAAVFKVHVERLKERYEAAKFGFAIDVGQAYARDAAPLMPLLNLTTYRVIQQAGADILDAGYVAQGLLTKQYFSAPRLHENQGRLYQADALQAAALDHGIKMVDDLREKRAAASNAGEPWLQGFAAHAQSVLSCIDSALSLPGADAVELDDVKHRLLDLVGKASAPVLDGNGLGRNDVYRETTQSDEAPGYMQAMQHGLAAIGGWLLTNGLLLTQRVGNGIEQNPGRAVGVLAAYAAISTFYTHWLLPAPGVLDEPPAQDGLTQLAIEVDIALAEPLPGHPDAPLGQLLQEALENDESRSRRSVSAGSDQPRAAQRRIEALMSNHVGVGGQRFGVLIRQAGGIPDSVDDASLASEINLGLQRLHTRDAQLQTAYTHQLDENIAQIVDDSVDLLTNLYAPILAPSAALETIIAQRISAYEKQTGAITRLKPDSLLRVEYTEVQPDNPNLHRTGARRHFKEYTLTEIVTDVHRRHVGLMRGPLGQIYKVVGSEQQKLIEFIDKSSIQATLEADLDAYKARPGIKSRTASFYEYRIVNAALNYVQTTPLTHPGHTLMADFLNGDLQASQVKFHGANINGVFAVIQGQTAVLCSVDDDSCFFIGEKVNRYWKFGAQQQETMPDYPSGATFKEWIRMKLPLIEQLKTSRNPAAFEITKTRFSTNAHVGMGRNGGQVNIKPLSFEPTDTRKKLSEDLFGANMDRIASDIDTLIFSDSERFGLEGLKVIRGILGLYGYLSMAMSPGTGSFLTKALRYAVPSLIIGASAGTSALQGAVSDDPTERDAANRQAFISMVSMGALMVLRQVIGPIRQGRNLVSMLKYHRLTNDYIIRPETFRIINQMLFKRSGAQPAAGGFASGAPIHIVPAVSQKAPADASIARAPIVPSVRKPLPWSQLDSNGRIDAISSKVLASAVGQRLTARTSKQAVTQSIANLLRLDSSGAARQPSGWRGERVEIRFARSGLEADSKRLDEVDRFLQELRNHPPALTTLDVNGLPESAAATWVASTSLVKVPQGQIGRVIEQFRQADLTDMKVVDDIHRALSGATTSMPTEAFRPSGTTLGSDIAHGAFEKSLKPLQVPDGLSRAAWLFALTRSYQPFATNNDPLARVLYAVAEVQGASNAGFRALAKSTETRLSPEGVVPKKQLPIKPKVRPEESIVDTRVEPFRQIDSNPSRELPVEMRGFMATLRSAPKLNMAFLAPAGECIKTSEIVAQFMHGHGFENIKYRGMLIWSSRNPDGVLNHFFPIGDYRGETYAFDLTAPQFASKGMPSLSEPLILPEPALMGLYQRANDRALIKYKDFSNLLSAEGELTGFRTPTPNQFIEGGRILNEGWHKSQITQPGGASSAAPSIGLLTPTRGIAQLTPQDLDKHRAARKRN